MQGSQGFGNMSEVKFAVTYVVYLFDKLSMRVFVAYKATKETFKVYVAKIQASWKKNKYKFAKGKLIFSLISVIKSKNK